MPVRTVATAEPPTEAVTISSGGLRAVLRDSGARLLEFHLPRRRGKATDVLLGRSSTGDGVGDRSDLGTTCGHYAGRVADARFVRNGRMHQLAATEGKKQVHGGLRGCDQHPFSVFVHPDEKATTVERESAESEEGYSGTLDAADHVPPDAQPARGRRGPRRRKGPYDFCDGARIGLDTALRPTTCTLLEGQEG